MRSLLLLPLAVAARAQAPIEPDALNRGAALPLLRSQPMTAPPAAGIPLFEREAADDNPWERVTTPSSLEPDSIGFYSRGCLRGAARLPETGPGFEKMRLKRHRSFGHPRLVEFLERFAGAVSREPKLGVLLIGDLGYARGGPFRSGHASHQTGLDVDVWYRQILDGRRPSDAEREEGGWGSPEMVGHDGTGFYTRLNAQWNENETEILRLAASDDQVQRIFVNPVIKKHLCARFGGAPWLAKIRAEWGHDDHFHVRLTCAGRRCQAQDPVPSEGCGPQLEQDWFSDAARETWRQMVERSRHPKPWRMPALPAECAQVLREP